MPARKPSPRKSRSPGKKAGVTYDRVRQLASLLPEVDEETSWGTPALKVRGKLSERAE